MVKHIVLFKFKKTGDIASVKATMREFKSALEALKDKIPFLRFIEVGINENTKEDFDMCLVTEFDSMEDLANYAVHPDHVAATQIIKDIKEGRACVDYTFLWNFSGFSMGKGLFKFSYKEYCQGIFAFFSFCNDVGGIGMIPFERGTDCSYRFL